MLKIIINHNNYTFSENNIEQDLLTLRKVFNNTNGIAFKSAHTLPADFIFILRNEIHLINFSRLTGSAWFIHPHKNTSGVNELFQQKVYALNNSTFGDIPTFPLWITQFNGGHYIAFSVKILRQAIDKNLNSDSQFPTPITPDQGFPWSPLDILQRHINIRRP